MVEVDLWGVFEYATSLYYIHVSYSSGMSIRHRLKLYSNLCLGAGTGFRPRNFALTTFIASAATKPTKTVQNNAIMELTK